MSAVAWFAGVLELAGRCRGWWWLLLAVAWLLGLLSTSQALIVLVLCGMLTIAVGTGRLAVRVGRRARL